MADPLTLRYNNPGAIEYKPFLAQYGATVGPNGRYAMFPDRASGYKAMEGLLGTYRTKHGLNTVEGIVNRWAPPNVDNNSTRTYTQKVAQQLGVDPRAPLDPSITPRLAEAMASYEAGRPVPRSGGVPPQSAPISSPSPQGASPVVNGIYDGLTPDDVASRRMMAQKLMGEATSTAPVGHWTGALARALTGLNSSLFREEASAGEKKGQASTQGFMQAAMANPQAAAASGMGNPWTAPVAQNIAGKVISNNLEQQSPAYQQQAQIRQGQIDMMPLERQKVEAQLAQIKTQTPEWRMQNAERFGIKRDSPEFRSFVVNGTLPSTADYGKAGAVFQGPDGKFYTAQFGSDGTRKIEPVTADGKPLEPAKGVKTVDTADGTRIISGATGGDVRQISKNIEGKEIAEAKGQAAGKAQANLPNVEALARRITAQIEAVEKDPRLVNVTGWAGKLPTIMPESITTEEKTKQLSSAAFLQAFESLKGAGAITEVEGEKATLALARLSNLKQDTEGYRQALKEFKQEIQNLVSVARAKAGGGTPAQAPAPSNGLAPGNYVFDPATGQVRPAQ